MEQSLRALSLLDLAVALIPVVVVAIIAARWLANSRQVAWAAARMLLQLLLVGYALQYIFAQDSHSLSLGILALMITISAAIALRPVPHKQAHHWQGALLGIGVGGSLNLALVIALFSGGSNWHNPHTLIPMAGMVYANCLNAVSLAAERFGSELERGQGYVSSRNQGFGAAMLPQINSLLAVGLVSLPGMMTGQILSGVSPLIAARYQIVVMCMIFGSAGISAAIYLWWLREPQSK
ncbi:ABC transporter permease [Porticoccus sp. W117]|uniref:ABC transporter permease n=1 Tax=Porticoccus sp. W117 TaxID=3054777 RepID=UPI00259312EB|nr:ABC transporter permease [Porticoccus sp. W117]MDM3869741.1 ABC transporter permease [Porticoccus sp. W117]